MDSQFLVLAFFSVVSLVCAFLLEHGRANRLAAWESLRPLLGVCIVSRVRNTRGGLELTLKNNTGKFCHMVAADHIQRADLHGVEGKLVAVSLDEAGELRFELVYEVHDSLELLLRHVEETLQEAASEWPLEGPGYKSALGLLVATRGPLDAERVRRALIFWERHYTSYPSIAGELTRVRLELRRQKLLARMSRALAS